MVPVKYSQITDEIIIDVSVLYYPEQSMPVESQYFFAYRITITNTSNETIQLMRRHWSISDGFGTLREVDGAGVVGLLPRIKPGDSFEYTSGCNLDTATGEMWGYYTIYKGKSKIKHQITIPRFYMQYPYALN